MKSTEENVAEYEPKGYEVERVKTGTQVEDEVVEIKEGTLKDFVKGSWEKFDKFGKSNPSDPAILVKTALGVQMLINVPKNGIKVSGNSHLGRWILTYDKEPFLHQTIKCVMNSNGFYEVYLAE